MQKFVAHNTNTLAVKIVQSKLIKQFTLEEQNLFKVEVYFKNKSHLF